MNKSQPSHLPSFLVGGVATVAGFLVGLPLPGTIEYRLFFTGAWWPCPLAVLLVGGLVAISVARLGRVLFALWTPRRRRAAAVLTLVIAEGFLLGLAQGYLVAGLAGPG
jgi:hypothetical protein